MAKGRYEYWLTRDGLLRLQAYARDGLIDEQIAHQIGISRATLYDWLKKYPDISDAIKRGKEVVDIEVENTLYKRAMGYTFNEDKYIAVAMSDEEYTEKLEQYISQYKYDHPEATNSDLRIALEQFPKTKMVLSERKVKEVVPDVTAQIFWLKNRKPEAWKDKQDVEHSGGIDVRNQYANMSDDELEALVSRYEKINNSKDR